MINHVQATLAGQASLAGDDPAVEAAVQQLVEALDPALRLVAMELAQQAAAEIGAQLTDRSVEVILSNGDPELRVVETRADGPQVAPDEEFDARITLRLPPSLKRVIEDSATIDGESVNAWVVEALSKRAKRNEPKGRRVTDAFDL
jgi:predicted HicB family RNase H-like nuclease